MVDMLPHRSRCRHELRNPPISVSVLVAAGRRHACGAS
ncbi:hypothetical protein YT1_4479 [Rhodococcus ruber]|nr:hypothetical protein YT1_4479 [Rhodococcus ruber]